MNSDNRNQNNVNRHRRLKYGALAVCLTAAVVALVVIVNAVFSALAVKHLWYIDMTKAQIYGITQQSKDLLDGYRGSEDFKISIVFCNQEDQLRSNYNTNLVHNLAKQYEEEFDFVSVEYVDIINHPEMLNKYMATSVSNPKTTSVIITNGKQSRLFEIKSFYTFDSDSGDVFAFNGEYRITAAILQLAGDNPIAYFIEGHGEENTGTVMWTLFEDAGFDVRTIDLSRENPDAAAKVMVINNPKYDYFGASGSVNEIRKIDNFLDNLGGLMVFLDASCGELPELETLLSEWGIRFEQQRIRDYDNSLSVDGSELIAEYVSEGTGSSLTSKLRELQSLPKAIVNNAKPITLTYTDGQRTVGSSVRYSSAILTTSQKKTAEAVSLTDASAAEKGVFNLMAITVDSRYIENEPHYAYVLAAGTSSFADDKYIGSRAYGNRDIIFNVMKNFSRKTVPLDLDFKVFESTELNISRGDANRWTVICTAVAPVIVAGIGIAVYTRRRYL